MAATLAFFAAVDLALHTGKTTNILRTSSVGCTCRGVIKIVESMYRKGRVVGGGVSISRLRLTLFEPTLANVDLVNDYPAFTVVDPAGKTVERGPPFRSNAFVRLRLWPSGWLVEDVDYIR